MDHIIVVGAGQAGAAVVARLRALGYAGALTLVGEEPAPPYQRPPLSKAYLLGDMAAERLWLRSAEFYGEQKITLRLGVPVTAIDAVARTVTLGGEVLGYSDLVLTTGSIPRTLPAAIGGDLPGVYTVRTLADVDAMRSEFAPGRRVVIVGGGYIGLEAAAVARKMGLEVTVLEMAPRILQRVAAPETSDFFRKLHSDHGVTILEDTRLDRILGTARVSGVGIVPQTALAEAAGVAIENGIRTDARGQTSDPHIWSAGDCASFPHQGGRLRLESVGNAIDEAEVVAENIMGAEVDYAAKPWFWSDQYECKLQIAGLNTGYDTIITRGSEGEAVSFWYFKGEALLSVDAMNDPRAYMVGKRLIESGKSPLKAALTDPATVLKDLLKA
jgi:3-phenylpropionate/trans-cinnamate dioxygenase ferredoxin reductase subunit